MRIFSVDPLPNSTKVKLLPKKVYKNKIGFFLGSSIGNFYNKEEKKFLKNAKKTLGKNSFLFVGVDLIKNVKILKKAYNDKGNFTAKFNKLAKSSGWHVKKHWKDTKKYYAVFLLQA